jgi:hypothetical protein
MAAALAVRKLALGAAFSPDPRPTQIGSQSGQRLQRQAPPTSIFASVLLRSYASQLRAQDPSIQDFLDAEQAELGPNEEAKFLCDDVA